MRRRATAIGTSWPALTALVWLIASSLARGRRPEVEVRIGERRGERQLGVVAVHPPLNRQEPQDNEDQRARKDGFISVLGHHDGGLLDALGHVGDRLGRGLDAVVVVMRALPGGLA